MLSSINPKGLVGFCNFVLVFSTLWYKVLDNTICGEDLFFGKYHWISIMKVLANKSCNFLCDFRFENFLPNSSLYWWHKQFSAPIHSNSIDLWAQWVHHSILFIMLLFRLRACQLLGGEIVDPVLTIFHLAICRNAPIMKIFFER